MGVMIRKLVGKVHTDNVLCPVLEMMTGKGLMVATMMSEGLLMMAMMGARCLAPTGIN